MELVVTHAKVSSGTEDPLAEVDLADWNDNHAVVVSGGTDTGLVYVSGSELVSSSVVQVATQDDYEFLYLGDTPIANSVARWPGGAPYPLIWTNRTVSFAEINDNTIVDFSELTATSNAGVGNQYASFNASFLVKDSPGINWNHLCGFEDLSKYQNTGTLAESWSFLSQPELGGPTTNRRAFIANDAQGAGAITNNYGLYVASLTRGTNNWGVYTAGATPSYIGGRLLLSTTAITLPTNPKLTISKNTAAPANAPSSNSLIYAYNADGTSSVIALDGYGTGANGAMVFRAAEGTAASPTNSQSGDFLVAFNVYGYNSTGGFSGGSAFGQGLMGLVATENFTSGGSGTAWQWWTNAAGGLSTGLKMQLGSGLVVGSSGTDQGVGTVNVSSNYYIGGVAYAAVTKTLTNTTYDSAGTGNVMQVSGVTISRGQFPGTSTNDAATAGNNGEVISSSVTAGSAVSLTSGTQANVTSISLTAGDWDVTGVIHFVPAATTSITRFVASNSTTSATLQTNPGQFVDNTFAAFVTGGNSVTATVSGYRFSLSSTTTIYLVALSSFTVSTMAAYGLLRARRIR